MPCEVYKVIISSSQARGARPTVSNAKRPPGPTANANRDAPLASKHRKDHRMTTIPAFIAKWNHPAAIVPSKGTPGIAAPVPGSDIPGSSTEGWWWFLPDGKEGEGGFWVDRIHLDLDRETSFSHKMPEKMN